MNELGQGFFLGLFSMYVMGIPLLYAMVEPVDEETDSHMPLKFAFMWPYAAMCVVYDIFTGGDRDDDGTGTT